MPQTFFENLLKSHGKQVTVEYQMEGETCACIVAKWPNTAEYKLLTAERSNLQAHTYEQDDAIGEKLRELDALIADMEENCLSDKEIERIGQWLSENHTQISDAGGWGDEIREFKNSAGRVRILKMRPGRFRDYR